MPAISAPMNTKSPPSTRRQGAGSPISAPLLGGRGSAKPPYAHQPRKANSLATILKSILLTGILMSPATGEEIRKDYNVFTIRDDKPKLKKIMGEIQKANACVDYSERGLTTVQHIEGKMYLVERGSHGRVEAAIIHEAESVLADGTELSGYIFDTDKTYSYVDISGAKATVPVKEFHDGKFPFKSEENFIKVLKSGINFLSYGAPVTCAKCTGFGEVKGGAKRDRWVKCPSCDGKRTNSVWYKFGWRET